MTTPDEAIADLELDVRLRAEALGHRLGDFYVDVPGAGTRVATCRICERTAFVDPDPRRRARLGEGTAMAVPCATPVH